jgi:hypothetical protein
MSSLRLRPAADDALLPVRVAAFVAAAHRAGPLFAALFKVRFGVALGP